MKTYVIYENHEDCGVERGITSMEQFLEQKALRVDTNGKPMTIVLEFSAETWEEAMQRYNDHYGYGKYIPME